MPGLLNFVKNVFQQNCGTLAAVVQTDCFISFHGPAFFESSSKSCQVFQACGLFGDFQGANPVSMGMITAAAMIVAVLHCVALAA